MTILFTADHHYGHNNIIRFQDRPFESVHEMNLEMTQRWNAVVKPEDTVYHLGDFSWNPRTAREALNRLNGTIHLVEANHEHAALKFRDRFASVSPLMEVQVPDPDAPRGTQLIVLCHFAMRVWNKSHWGSWHLYGHSHGKLADLPESLSFDVGVDCWDFTPLSYQQVKEIMARKTWTPPHKDRRGNRT